MKATTFHGGEEFEVTEADFASLAPLGDLDTEEKPTEVLAQELKKCIVRGTITATGIGFWDAYLDEGEWTHDPAIECEDGDFCCFADHMICTRAGNQDHDDVFVRLPGGYWEDSFQIFARDRSNHRAQVTINGETYTPEDCLKDLRAVLGVFRFFVARGDL